MLTSAIRFLDLATGRPCNFAPAGGVRHSSTAAGWSSEVIVERLSLPPTERPEHGILDHRLIVNRGAPVRFGWHRGDRPCDGVLATGAIHVQPHGAVNRPRWLDRLEVASLAFAPALIERLMDGRSPASSEVLVESLGPAEAALAAGFYDQAHLTNTMRRYRGTTPGAVFRARKQSA